MRVLVTGAGGQLGRAIVAALSARDSDLTAQAGIEVLGCDRAALDITDAETAARTLSDLRPQIVINCAGFTAVDAAEREPERAFAVNAVAAGRLAAASAASGARFVHVSTDYVFGTSRPGPHGPQDPAEPACVYGLSKHEGEVSVQAADPGALVFRCGWLYAADGHGFLQAILRQFAQRDEVAVVADQRGTPTAAAQIARFMADAIVMRASARGSIDLPAGVYHLAAAGEASWFDFATAIEATGRSHCPRLSAGWRVRRILPISRAQYGAAARRPADSRLDCDLTWQRFGHRLGPWREALTECMREIEQHRAPVQSEP
jgi:dTDP-4-dehydrorhamnose reductase